MNGFNGANEKVPKCHINYSKNQPISTEEPVYILIFFGFSGPGTNELSVKKNNWMFLKQHFDLDSVYKLLKNEKDEGALIICSSEVDSVCAAKILVTLLKSDLIKYSLKSVQSIQALISDKTNWGRFSLVVLINCGGGEDLLEILNPPPHLVFYVVDSRYPLHPKNIEDTKHVALQLK
jgi:hypothetical protein